MRDYMASAMGKGPQIGGPSVSITVTVTTAILLIVGIGIGAVGLQQWTMAKRTTDELMQRNATLVIDQVDTYLAQFMEPAANYTRHMAARALMTGWNEEATPITGEELAASIAAAPEIVSAGMLYNSGRDVRVEQRDGKTVSQEYQRKDVDYFEDLRPFLSLATEPKWAPPIFDPGLDESIINVWHVVRGDGRFYGAWYAGVSLAAISEAIADVGDSLNGTAFVIHGEKNVLAHANLMSSHPEPTFGSPTVGIGRIGDYILEGIWDKAQVYRESDDLSSDMATLKTTVDGQEYFGFFRRLYRYGQKPWTIGVWFEASDLGRYYERLIAAAWIGGFLIVLALLVAVLAGRLISGPIRRTATAVSAVSNGNLETSFELPASRITELNDLANSVNSMRFALSLFETYVPRSLVRRMITKQDKLIVSSERQLTVMFTDIVGFTTMAEGRSATEVADLVNDHFRILGHCVEDHGGTIDKYIGDALMAFWGAPDDMEDTSTAACYCAMAMVDALEKDNHKRKAEGLDPVRVRIGIHTGPALVGNIGAEGRVNYTIIGDTVNTCQRIENLGREIDNSKTATILISDTVAKYIPSSMPYMHVGSFSVKGRDENVEAYRLVT